MHEALIRGLIAVSFGLCGSAAAQDRLNGNVGVTALTASVTGKQFVCSATIQNIHDDTARDVTLVVLMPVEVITARLPAGCAAVTTPKAGKNYTGFVQCRWAELRVGQSASVQIGSTISPVATSRTCGAFVWNRLPDIDPSNNYKTATAP